MIQNGGYNMYFLIDYENVNYAGLEGTEFLEEGDTVIIFFSDKCDKIVGYRMMDIENSGCSFEICKLKNVRKNALDYYIASKVGEIFAMDRQARIAIISEDKGFQSILDYWRVRLIVSNQLVYCKTIAKGIRCVDGNNSRKMLVDEKMKILDIQTEFVKYEERRRIIEKMKEIFLGTAYEKYISQIVNMVIFSEGPKLLYINSLKSFGKKIGTDVYRKIKKSINVQEDVVA